MILETKLEDLPKNTWIDIKFNSALSNNLVWNSTRKQLYWENTQGTLAARHLGHQDSTVRDLLDVHAKELYREQYSKSNVAFKAASLHFRPAVLLEYNYLDVCYDLFSEHLIFDASEGFNYMLALQPKTIQLAQELSADWLQLVLEEKPTWQDLLLSIGGAAEKLTAVYSI